MHICTLRCNHACTMGAIMPPRIRTHRRDHACTSACIYAHISMNIFTFVSHICAIMCARVWEVSDFCCSCNDEIRARTSCFSKPFQLSNNFVHHLAARPKSLGVIAWLLHCCCSLAFCAKGMAAARPCLIVAMNTQAWSPKTSTRCTFC